MDALVDPLTGLGNRRDFYKSFAWVNAHATDDAILQHVAQVLSDHLRSTDMIFRWEARKFIVLMPEAPIREVRQISERLHRQSEMSPYIGNETIINVTISLGLYCAPAEMKMEEQIARADLNLYEAKRTGRNHVCG